VPAKGWRDDHRLLRDCQPKSIDRVRDAFRSGAKASAAAPDHGQRKDCCLLQHRDQCDRKCKRALVLARRRELIKQAAAKLGAAGVVPGIVAAGFPAEDAPMQVGSIPTLDARIHRNIARPPVNLIVLD
jgi:hypothetical protein